MCKQLSRESECSYPFTRKPEPFCCGLTKVHSLGLRCIFTSYSPSLYTYRLQTAYIQVIYIIFSPSTAVGRPTIIGAVCIVYDIFVWAYCVAYERDMTTVYTTVEAYRYKRLKLYYLQDIL